MTFWKLLGCLADKCGFWGGWGSFCSFGAVDNSIESIGLDFLLKKFMPSSFMFFIEHLGL